MSTKAYYQLMKLEKESLALQRHVQLSRRHSMGIM